MRLREPCATRGRLRITLGARLLIVALSLSLLCLSSGANAADTPPISKSPFGITAGQTAANEQTSSFASFTNAVWSVLLFEQHKLTQAMTGAVRNLKSTTNFAAATEALIAASFVYGILHAAGPGHGKAIISSYMLADKETLRRGIFLAFLSSLIQALSAIALIGSLYLAARATGLQTKWAEAWLETLSWGFVALIGAWLMLKQLLPLFQRKTENVGRHPNHVSGSHVHDAKHNNSSHEHDHVHDREHGANELSHSHSHGDVLIAERPVVFDQACRHTHSHSHSSDHKAQDPDAAGHVHDEHCGHVHLPGPDELKGDLSWGKALAIAFSIGIRPCTGALLVIIFAASQGLIWAGVLATFAMAFGTALTVSTLAAVSVGSRNLAIAMAGPESSWGMIVARTASFVSSAAVFVLGTAFFFASLHDTRPF